MKEKELSRYSNIDFIRFIFSVIIVYFHILHANILPYTNGQNLYVDLQTMTQGAGRIVEGFLLMAGFFLYQSYQKHRTKSFFEFTLDKLARLWPVYAFSVLLSIFFYKSSPESIILDLCFLRCTGISMDYKGITWYIGPFFWSCLIIFAVLKYFDSRKTPILLATMAYLGYCVNLNSTHGGLGRETIFSFLSLGMLRILSGLCVGCLLAIFLKSCKKYYIPKHANLRTTVIIISIIELVTLGILLSYFLIGKPQFNNAFATIIIFIAYFTCALNNTGLISKLTNHKFFSFMGKYAYAIYVMQQSSFFILSKTLWTKCEFLYAHTYRALVISIIFSVLLGIAVYHLIEQPAIKVYKKWKEETFTFPHNNL